MQYLLITRQVEERKFNTIFPNSDNLGKVGQMGFSKEKRGLTGSNRIKRAQMGAKIINCPYSLSHIPYTLGIFPYLLTFIPYIPYPYFLSFNPLFLIPYPISCAPCLKSHVKYPSFLIHYPLTLILYPLTPNPYPLSLTPLPLSPLDTHETPLCHLD